MSRDTNCHILSTPLYGHWLPVHFLSIFLVTIMCQFKTLNISCYDFIAYKTVAKWHDMTVRFSSSPSFLQYLHLFWNCMVLQPFNPLSPNSDQHQVSPNNIHMLPREMVMRVNKMTSKEEML